MMTLFVITAFALVVILFAFLWARAIDEMNHTDNDDEQL